MNSKGITPLVATVLLVVVVVAIAALIYTWMIGFTGGTLGTAETTGRDMPGEARFIVESCSLDNNRIVLRNMGTIDLTGFTVYCVESDGSSSSVSFDSTTLGAGQSTVISSIGCLDANTTAPDDSTVTVRVRVKSNQFPNLTMNRECY